MNLCINSYSYIVPRYRLFPVFLLTLPHQKQYFHSCLLYFIYSIFIKKMCLETLPRKSVLWTVFRECQITVGLRIFNRDFDKQINSKFIFYKFYDSIQHMKGILKCKYKEYSIIIIIKHLVQK